MIYPLAVCATLVVAMIVAVCAAGQVIYERSRHDRRRGVRRR